jgi:hypothetical protein
MTADPEAKGHRANFKQVEKLLSGDSRGSNTHNKDYSPEIPLYQCHGFYADR